MEISRREISKATIVRHVCLPSAMFWINRRGHSSQGVGSLDYSVCGISNTGATLHLPYVRVLVRLTPQTRVYTPHRYKVLILTLGYCCRCTAALVYTRRVEVLPAE